MSHRKLPISALSDRQLQFMVSLGVDITERTRAAQTINLYANVYRHSADAIIITDHDNCTNATPCRDFYLTIPFPRMNS